MVLKCVIRNEVEILKWSLCLLTAVTQVLKKYYIEICVMSHKVFHMNRRLKKEFPGQGFFFFFLLPSTNDMSNS